MYNKQSHKEIYYKKLQEKKKIAAENRVICTEKENH
jgi:hypothetical protein